MNGGFIGDDGDLISSYELYRPRFDPEFEQLAAMESRQNMMTVWVRAREVDAAYVSQNTSTELAPRRC